MDHLLAIDKSSVFYVLVVEFRNTSESQDITTRIHLAVQLGMQRPENVYNLQHSSWKWR